MPCWTMGEVVTFDPTITTGNILEIAAITTGGLLALGALKSTISSMKNDMTDMKAELKKVGDILVTMARVDQRVLILEQDLREMKHGRGFIQDEIKGEWPRP